MNKKMRELLAKMQSKQAAAKEFMEGDNKDIAKANGLMDEYEALQAEYNAEKRMFEAEKANNAPTQDDLNASGVDKSKAAEPKRDVIKEFADAARAGFVSKTMTEGTPADGGYTVPEDITTTINEYKTAKASLLNLVRVEKVTTKSGSRTFKDRAAQTGFTKVGEAAAIGAKGTPTFSRIDYDIDKYAGYFPVTNELLKDSDANIVSTITEWIGDESRVTANKLILEQVATKAQTDLVDLDGIKKALNVTLGSAFKATSVIVTNDDGLQYLDTLTDATGHPLLAPSPTDPLQMRLAVGASYVPIQVFPNADLATVATKVPFIIGDLKEGIVFWDRELLTITTSTTGVVGALNAFEQDLTLFRAIEREDVTVRDAAAFVNGYITVA